MSVVTNAILHYEHLEGLLEKVNEYFPEGQGFVAVDDPRLPSGWYGGTKYLECELAIGAFNHLDLDRFLAHLCSLDRLYIYDLQLMVKEQEESRFRLINIEGLLSSGSTGPDGVSEAEADTGTS